MKNKLLIIILVVLFVVATIVCGFVFVPKFIKKMPTEHVSEKQETTENNIPNLGDGKEFFKISNIEEARFWAEKYGLNLESSEYDFRVSSIYDAECCKIPVQFDFVTEDEESEKLINLSCHYIPFSDEYKNVDKPVFSYSGKDLKKEIFKFIEMIENVYDIVINENFFLISSSDGKLLSNSDEKSYDNIISNKAFLDFSLKDEKGNYWLLRSNRTEEGIVYLTFTNYYNDQTYLKNAVHVNMNEK